MGLVELLLNHEVSLTLVHHIINFKHENMKSTKVTDKYVRVKIVYQKQYE